MVEAATEFKKSGYDEADSAQLAKVASLYQNIADEQISAGEAANFIISQMKAFNLTADDSEHIIDAVNNVSNNMAVSSADLATNIGKASAALATGNNTYEETLALMTGIVEITRSGTKAARGLVSVQSRLNQIVDENSSTGKALTAWYEEHNIAIYDQAGQLRKLYDILHDVAEIWPKLTTNEKDYYLNQQAGANQSVNLAAALTNFEGVEKALTLALDANGSALNENTAYMESLEAKTNNLKATFQDLANNVIDDELVGAVLDLANGFLQLANTDLGRIVTQITLLTGVGWGATGLLQASKIIPAVISQFKNFGAAASLAASGASGFFEALSVGGGVLTGILPVILAVAAALAVGGALWKATEDSRKSIDELNDSIDTDNQKLETNKERLDEINGMAWNDKTPEILAEKDALEKENAELQAQIEKYQQLKAEKAQAILDNAYGTETTYSTQRVQGKETLVPTTELIKGAEYYELLTQKLQKYQTILQQNKSLTNEQVVEYNNLTSEAGRLASAMENVEGGVASCTNEQQLMYNTLQSTMSAYDQAVNGISYYVSGLIDQANQTGVAEDALYDLVAAEIQTNNTGLDFSQQMMALQQLAVQAGIAANAISSITGVTYKTSEGYKRHVGFMMAQGMSKADAEKKIMSDYWSSLSGAISKLPKTTGGTTGGGGRGGGGGTSTSKQTQKNKKEAKDAVKEVKKDAEAAVDDVSDSVSDALNEQKQMMQGVIDYYVEYASRQIEKIDEQLDAINSKYDAMLDAAQKRYDDQLAALEDQYNAVEDQYELQKLMDNLEKAKRTYQMVYRDGQFVYEVDAEKVKEAQEALSAYKRKKEYEERKKQLEESLKNETEYIENLRKNETAALEEEKKRWEEYKKGWSELTSEYEFQQNKLLADQMFGAEQENATWQTRLANLQSFVSQYNSLMASLSGGGGGGGSSSGGSSFIGEPGASDGGHSTSWGYDHYKELGYKSYEDWYWNEYMKGEAKNWTAVEENFYKQALKNDLGIDDDRHYSLEDTDYAALMEASAKRGDLAGMTYWARERQNKLATTGQTDVESTRDIYESLKNKYGLGDSSSSSSSSSKSDKDSGSNYKPGGVSHTDQSKIMSIEDEIERNSQAWFDADEEERKRLHERNEQLRKELEKLNPNGYASGTTSARGGLAMVGEQGPELRVLNRGDGIVPADITRNLMKIGANPKWFAQQSGAGNTILNVANVSLPSVQNAQQFVDGLKNLALQKAYGRT